MTREREEQRRKAYSPMKVRPAGRSMEESDEQPSKALLPMETRLRGKATETREVRLRNAPVRQVRHAFRQHRVPVGDDDLPASHAQSLGGAGRRRVQMPGTDVTVVSGRRDHRAVTLREA